MLMSDMNAAGRGTPFPGRGVAESATQAAWAERAIVLLLAVLAAAIYGQTLGFDFQRNWDDGLYVAANPEVADGLGWRSLEAALSVSQTANWHPLTLLSHALDVSLFGLSPGPHHLVNAALHFLVAWSCFRLLRLCALNVWHAAGVALLFVVHPLQVESVAWITERKNLLCALFWLLSAQYYLKWQRRQGTASELLCFIFALAAMLAKPAAVMLPVTLLLFDYWPLGRISAARRLSASLSLVREKGLFIAVALLVAWMTYYIQNRLGFTWLHERTAWGDRLGNAVTAYGDYLGRFLVPDGLHYLYPWQPPDWLGRVVPGGLLLAAVSGLLWRLRERHAVMLFGWLWFLVVPLPTLGLVQVGAQSSADRYMYVPIFGLLLVCIHLVGLTTTKLGRLWPILLLLPLGGWSVLAYQQTATWASDESRLQQALTINPQHCHARTGFSALLLERGQRDLAGAWLEDVRRRCTNPRIQDWAGRLQARLASVGEAPLRRAQGAGRGG